MDRDETHPCSHGSPPYAVLTPFLPLKLFHAFMPRASAIRQGGLSVVADDRLQAIRSGIGSVAVKTAVASLSGRGVRALLFLGSCGGIGTAGIGDTIVARRAYEGGNESAPETAMEERLASFLAGRTAAVHRGAVMTVAAPMTGGSPLFEQWESTGVCAVDMECFHVFKAAAGLNIPAAAVLYVTDTPGKKPCHVRHDAADRQRIVSARDNAVRASVEFLYSYG